VKGKTGRVGSHLSYRGTRLAVQVVEDREGGFHRVGVHPDNEPEVEDSADMRGPLVSDTEERERAVAASWAGPRGAGGRNGSVRLGPPARKEKQAGSWTAQAE
jgi:hypothetical protein